MRTECVFFLRAICYPKKGDGVSGLPLHEYHSIRQKLKVH